MVLKIRGANAGTTTGVAAPKDFIKSEISASKSYLEDDTNLGDDDSELLAVQMIENDGRDVLDPEQQAQCGNNED